MNREAEQDMVTIYFSRFTLTREQGCINNYLLISLLPMGEGLGMRA